MRPTLRHCTAGTIIALAALLPLLALAALTFPALTGRVVDDAHLLSPESAQKLDAELAAEEQRSGAQVVVATVPSLQGREIEEYGYQLGRDWGIGQKGKNNGALIIVAPNERRARIEAGYGLEGELTDAASSAIVNSVMVPAFKTGNYDQGIVQGTEAVLSVLQGGEPPVQASDQSQGEGSKIPALFMIGLFILLMCSRGGRSALSTMLILGAMGGRGGGGGGNDRFGGGGGSFGGGGASGRW